MRTLAPASVVALGLALLCGSTNGCVAAEPSEEDARAEAAVGARAGEAPFLHGLVSGRIYDDLAKHGDARMRDMGDLGVQILRIEVESSVPIASYKRIVEAARRKNIEVLALVTRNAVDGSPSPMNGTLEDFDRTFVPAYVSAVDRVVRELGVRYVEVWNEPDVYDFTPLAHWTAARGCEARPGAERFGLLATRVYETMLERRAKGVETPTIVSFSFSRHDDACVRSAVYDSQPVKAYRALRASRGERAGLPTDIIGIHGYGNEGRMPSERGYSYLPNGTFADAVDDFLAARFADGAPVVSTTPVWYTELGFCQKPGIDAEGQARALTEGFAVLRARPQVKAVFAYSYRDDEPGGHERCGLRKSSVYGFAPNPSHAAYRTLARQSRSTER